MTDHITLSALTAFVMANAPAWLASLRGVVFDEGRNVLLEQGKVVGGRLTKRVFQLDEKEQLRHLELALKNAIERGLTHYANEPLQCRDQYRGIIHTLSQPGSHAETLRRETMRLFTLSEMPDLARLTEIYNQYQRTYDLSYQDIDAAPYLSTFFSALLEELYADPYFRQQLSDALQLRAVRSIQSSMNSMQHSLLDIVQMLQKINATLADNYSADDLAHDIQTYTAHLERTLHYLKIVGIVPKDQNADPELSGIFVPPHIALRGESKRSESVPWVLSDDDVVTLYGESKDSEPEQNELVAMLERTPCLVLLGGPGIGKSTATKYLAWSHVAANQSLLVDTTIPTLSGRPIPLRIELRLLNEERKRANYDFLTYATDVLLKREGIEVRQQMFKELLLRHGMVLIFDGLDEVNTLQERLSFINEIEHFALCYPGNRILVTSRPVGYDLARFSHPLFSHAEVQSFDDAQIQQFLERWYTAVLRLNPIPPKDREELELLLTTLRENSRLHKLAENPLLLTVITALHRYERLPDRRVQVYDRCAELLLEKWAALKGTNKRWQDMQMTRDDQYACVAYLGFILHARAQEEAPDQIEDATETTVDVTAHFLRKKVVDFLRERDLLQKVEQFKEAERFISLIQQEAGLIVERGIDENGEALYGFVHRTFQEYFAAADIYERYLQAEDPEIISNFLKERLHDPHWSEVIALLLGKLKSGPVTRQLRHILTGKIRSIRSAYTEFIQQDLFFICDCLIDEIQVSPDFVRAVISQLEEVVQNPYFPAQQREALDYLGKLMRTRQYGELGGKELLLLATKEGILDDAGRLEALQTLYLSSNVNSEVRDLASQNLIDLVKREDLAGEQILEVAVGLLYRSSAARSSAADSEGRQVANRMLMEVVKREDLTVEQIQRVAELLYRNSAAGSEGRQVASRLLMEVVKREDLTGDQRWEIAVSLYSRSSEGSEGRQVASRVLMEVKREGLTVEQIQRVAELLYRNSAAGSEGRQVASRVLMEVKREGLTVEQIQRVAELLYYCSERDSKGRRVASNVLMELAKRGDLTEEQMWGVAQSIYHCSVTGSEERQVASRVLLMELAKREDLTVEQIQRVAVVLYYCSEGDSEGRQVASRVLMELAKRGDLTGEQMREVAESLYHCSEHSSEGGSEERQVASRVLMGLAKREDLTGEQMREVAESLYRCSPEGSEESLIATSILLKQLPLDLRVKDIYDVYRIFCNMIPQFHKLQDIKINNLERCD